MLDVRRARKEVVAAVGANAVFFGEQRDVAGLCDWIAAEVNDTRWSFLQQCCNNVDMQAGARRVNGDDFTIGDVNQDRKSVV